ncbi:glycosyltransferase family 2 protein [Xylanimonas oleitrophica]|uniref:glycosyltransferase family 2 protein n=1 Tax=Xylanimonas oleitrophica TaxID=2607479 RepID=UPI0015CFED65|nr:glycosyltransferase family 2 protein [Xylanimonas oleitrophica]
MGDQTAAGARVTVAVLTYRRPSQVAALVPLLLSQLDALETAVPGARGRLVVVDNDPAGSGRAAVERVVGGADRRLRCVVEPAPGISAARNRALDEAAPSDAVVFVDDDETPAAGWLTALVGAWRRYAAGAVAGPVVSVFAEEPDPWVRAGGFYDREHRAVTPTGRRLGSAATSNLLLDAATVRRLGLRFDPAFGLTGGEDSRFTAALTAAGAPLVWCREAVVTDHVPPERATRAYVLHRTTALADATARVRLLEHRGGLPRLLGRARVLATAACRAGLGVALWGRGRWREVVLRRAAVRDDARAHRHLARARGELLAAVDRHVQPYART